VRAREPRAKINSSGNAKVIFRAAIVPNYHTPRGSRRFPLNPNAADLKAPADAEFVGVLGGFAKGVEDLDGVGLV
jgi:hypothetical protein